MRAHLPDGRRRRVRRLVLEWYHAHRRALPWRRTRDPWAVLVSEILLHQTQVDRVVPVYERFLERWPTPQTCAAAPLAEVKAVTDPLGYKARGGWLHAIATSVGQRPAPYLPHDPTELRRLRGIGRYTAGAVASIAYDRPTPLVDTNVRRLFERLFRLPPVAPPGAAGRAAELWALARILVAGPDPGSFNQGLMELGALVCRPRRPRCGICPLEPVCASRRPRLRPVHFLGPSELDPPGSQAVSASR
ncbi:MAG TPA: A/G-specific adenine glycosylase [Candidatus Dormibacteraeota bacterium]|nr:A/G-specific adenine glycosylase [Candidatus Dormibacteraeota bacterium]